MTNEIHKNTFLGNFSSFKALLEAKGDLIFLFNIFEMKGYICTNSEQIQTIAITSTYQTISQNIKVDSYFIH